MLTRYVGHCFIEQRFSRSVEHYNQTCIQRCNNQSHWARMILLWSDQCWWLYHSIWPACQIDPRPNGWDRLIQKSWHHQKYVYKGWTFSCSIVSTVDVNFLAHLSGKIYNPTKVLCIIAQFSSQVSGKLDKIYARKLKQRVQRNLTPYKMTTINKYINWYSSDDSQSHTAIW